MPPPSPAATPPPSSTAPALGAQTMGPSSKTAARSGRPAGGGAAPAPVAAAAPGAARGGAGHGAFQARQAAGQVPTGGRARPNKWANATVIKPLPQRDAASGWRSPRFG